LDEKSAEYFVTSSGRRPFIDWFEELGTQSQVVVTRYIDRLLSGGKYQNVKSLKDGVFELKINYGSGLRVYFAQEGAKIILLLLGGNKTSQEKDIKKAKRFWRDYGKKK